MNTKFLSFVLCGSLALMLWGCAIESGIEDNASGEQSNRTDTTSSSDWGYWDSQSDDIYVPPPEEELELQEPQAAKDFVFIASTTQDTVAKINAQNLDIESVAVGSEPRVVRTNPMINSAGVLNFGSADLSIIHAKEDDTEVARLKLERYLNQMRLSPQGEYLAIFYDPELAAEDDPVGNLQTLQIARIKEGEEAIVTLSVSFLVRDVYFDESGNYAVVVCDEYLHLIDLAEVLDDPLSHDPADRVSLLSEDFVDSDWRELELTADARFVVIRDGRVPSIMIIDLTTLERAFLDLEAIPTDLDLQPSGGGLAVLRETNQLVLFELADAMGEGYEPTVVEAGDLVPVGQAELTPEGDHALVFSTAAGGATLGWLDMESAELYAHRLGSGKTIGGALLGPTGDWVYVSHVADLTSEDPVARTEGFSLLTFGEAGAFDKLYQTETMPTGVIFMEDGGHLFAIQDDRDFGVRELMGVQLDTLEFWHRELGSPPVVLGTLPQARRVYVGQEHSLGRISFVDVASGSVQTVTGFELNSLTR